MFQNSSALSLIWRLQCESERVISEATAERSDGFAREGPGLEEGGEVCLGCEIRHIGQDRGCGFWYKNGHTYFFRFGMESSKSVLR